MTKQVFAVPVFFIVFRECLECVIVISILLAFLKKSIGPERDRVTYKKLVRQIWWGIGLGLFVCLCVGAGFIGAFYAIGKNAFGTTEDVWEGTFGLLATIIISVVGVGLLRVSKLQDKWRIKVARALERHHKDVKMSAKSRFKLWCEKYAMFLLPFVTVLREGLEAIVFIGGVGLGLPGSAFPLAVFCGLVAGLTIGYLIYKFGNTAKLQVFLIVSTCFLYLVAAGLFSKAVWFFENYIWGKTIGGDASETGSGPGSYNIHNSVWHVNCCNPQLNGGGGWGVFNALFGWTNSATYGSVISYNVYWIAVIATFACMRYYEVRGHWPLMKAKKYADDSAIESDQSSEIGAAVDLAKKDGHEVRTSTTVREMHNA